MTNKENYIVLTDEYGVRDVNRAEDNEILSMLVEEPPGHPPQFIDGSTENVLLYMHEMKDILYGKHGALLSEDPHISVKPSASESVYRITVNDRPVESMPHQSDDVLEAVKDAVENKDLDPILDVYKHIIDSQVRRDVVGELIQFLDILPEGRLRITSDGWLVDNYYLVDWTASMYVVEDDRDSPDYVRHDNSVKVTDKSRDFIGTNALHSPKSMAIRHPDGEDLILGEREMMFLSKVKWLLERTKYHKDEPFWRWNENRRKDYLQNG